MDFEYYISTIDENGKYVIYDSEIYKLSEIDIINLVKVCLIERRNQKIGNKLLEIYKDSTQNRKEITQKRLSLIGVETKNGKPTTTRNATSK